MFEVNLLILMIQTEFGIIPLLREPAIFRPLLPEISWENQPEKGWPPQVQTLLDALYTKSGIGSSEDARLAFWRDWNTDRSNAREEHHLLGIHESQFLMTLFPEHFHVA